MGGRPRGSAGKNSKSQLLKEAFRGILDLPSAKELVKEAVAQAKAGNPRLLAAILPYCEQALPRAVEHSGPDTGPIEVNVKML